MSNLKIDKIILWIALIISFIILLFSVNNFLKCKNKKNIEINMKAQKDSTRIKNIEINELGTDIENKINLNRVEVKEYSIMPQYIQNFLVIGQLKIPSINLDTYILNETSNKSLNVSVTKLAGPNINEKGNFCITGHNYIKDNMFGKLKKVNINDNIILIDTFGKQKEYKVCEKKEVTPDDVSVLKQDTNGSTEVTLITCNTGAKKRIVVKAK